MYVCGPTVYNHVHIGNARPVIVFDLVRRYFEYLGYEVNYISNITDVDDKIIQQAIKEGVDERVIAKKYTDAFLQAIDRLNIIGYDLMPKVTEHIEPIVTFIEQLVEQGYAYEVDGDVYFRVTKLESYGRLSNQDTEQLEVGARITENVKKDNPLDFTLWKKTEQGVKWASPWSEGRPGWHTECVAMIHNYLGTKIDIHGGGSDLKFPHHENEIAQSEAIAGTAIANYWMHNGRLMIEDEKMSKSIGNIISLKDFLDRYDYRVLRFFMISTHYRQPINYTDEAIEQAVKEVEKINTAATMLKQMIDLHTNLAPMVSVDRAVVDPFIKTFKASLNDDFNTSNAITVIQSMIKEINRRIRRKTFTEEELAELTAFHLTFHELLDVLGLSYTPRSLTTSDIASIAERDAARENKDYDKADALRKQLKESGIYL